MSAPFHILGLDLSLASTGWAVIDADGALVDHGIIETIDRWPLGERLLIMTETVDNIITEFEPADAGIEAPFAGRSGTSTIHLGMVHGVVRLILHEKAGIDPHTVAPSSLKKYATGTGTATKDQMIAAAVKRWGPSVYWTGDTADATWVAEHTRVAVLAAVEALT